MQVPDRAPASHTRNTAPRSRAAAGSPLVVHSVPTARPSAVDIQRLAWVGGGGWGGAPSVDGRTPLGGVLPAHNGHAARSGADAGPSIAGAQSVAPRLWTAPLPTHEGHAAIELGGRKRARCPLSSTPTSSSSKEANHATHTPSRPPQQSTASPRPRIGCHLLPPPGDAPNSGTVRNHPVHYGRIRMEPDTHVESPSSCRRTHSRSSTQLDPHMRWLHPPHRWTHHPSNPLGSLTPGLPLHRRLRTRTLRRRKPPLPITPYSKYSKPSMYSTRACTCGTSAACTQLPRCPQSADSDTPPPGAAITPTRRAKTPSQNPMRTTTTHVGF